MCNKGWIKRALPFLGTFALGLFIASFFVSITPSSSFRDRRMHHFGEMQRLRMENDELRQENLRLRNKLGMDWGDDSNLENYVAPGEEMMSVPPPPPPAPHAHR